MIGRFEDKTGKKYGRLTVVERDFSKGNHESHWLCLCECGNTISTSGIRLSNGSCKSCGCLQKELLSKRMSTHKETKTRLYNIWSKIKFRCYNTKSKDYGNYGGRGIKMCDQWKNSFENFRDWALNNGYKDTLTIDRIDVNSNYSPENCKWCGMKEQSRNTRFNRRYDYNGKSLCTAELAEIAGISGATLRYRLNQGYNLQEAMFKPLRKLKRRTQNG